jgi:predicted NAD/FAD-binding protein
MAVKAEDRLGGHTQTPIDPLTGGHVDYGVVVWHDLPVVRRYFVRMNMSLVKDSIADTGSI